MITPAIVVIAYNRPDTMSRLLESIKAASYGADSVTLIISIDRAANYEEVYAVAEEFQWTHGEKIIISFEERQGLKKHVLQCGDLALKYQAVIVLEDDLVVSPAFYEYALQAINFYSDEPKVAGTALYSHNWNGYSGVSFLPVKNQYDTYFGQFSITWGQCWTDKQWKKFRDWQTEHDGRLPAVNDNMPSGISQWGKQSWGKYFVSYVVEKDLYYAVPYVGLSTNFSEAGTHNTHADNSHQVRIQVTSGGEYRFASYEDAIKYDVFFERIFPDTQLIGGHAAKDICVNLNGKKTWNFGKRYMLSARTEKYESVCDFGLRMHPIDQNIDFCVTGNDIHLYDVEIEKDEITKGTRREDLLKRTQYEAYGLNFFKLYPYVIKQFLAIVRIKLRIK